MADTPKVRKRPQRPPPLNFSNFNNSNNKMPSDQTTIQIEPEDEGQIENEPENVEKPTNEDEQPEFFIDY